MGYRFICSLQRVLPTSTFHFISSKPLYVRSTFDYNHFVILPSQLSCSFNQWKSSWDFRCYSHGLVNLVISQGKPKFETHETDPPKKEKWKTKKRLKMQRLREKKKRKSANKRDPRCLGVKGKKKKQKFPNAEERIKYKIKMAKVKEELLIERLKRYEISRAEGPVIKPENLTGEERFYMKKMAQKRSNYVPVGRRGIFGGVILNMHLHWKKHETVKVICKPCKPGQVHEYAKEISRLSGGIPIQIIGNDTFIFYRGKDYVQPEVMSPIDTLSKKKALEKSKYEQSLESVRRFIAIAEKELELYYRHVALYGDPEDKSHHSLSTEPINGFTKLGNSDTSAESSNSISDDSSTDVSDLEDNATNHQLQSEVDSDDDNMSGTETDLEYGSSDFSSEDDMATTSLHERSTLDRGSSIAGGRKQFEVQQFQVTGL